MTTHYYSVMKSSFTPLDVEKLLRRPKKGDPLVPAPTPLFTYGLDPADACARGYRLAAELVVDHIRQRSSEQSFLFYPAVFLYRHYVELMLKKLILASDEPGVRTVTQITQLSESVREDLAKGKKAHRLTWLWEQFRPAALALGDVSAQDIDGINFYIQQLSSMDPDSTSFRYTTGIDKTRANLTAAQKPGTEVDIIKFADTMESLINYFEGMDNYISMIIEYDNEIASEMQGEMYDSFY
jgi:hypothetical protein